MTNEKHFPKTISQWEFDYGLFTNLPRIIVTCDFSPRYPNLKTTCHIKLKFFLWTKLIEKLLLAKYVISITPPLNDIVIIKLRYSIKPKHGRYVKGYGFLFFGKNICKSVIGKYIQKLPDGAKKSTTDAIKTASKRVVQKRAEATVDLF